MGKITRMQILYPLMQWKPHSCILKYERQFWHKVQSMVLKIFICPSHIANWSLGLLESIGYDRHPIRALGSFHYQKYLHMINKCHSIWKLATRKTRFWHNSCIGIYGKYLQVKSREIKRWSIYWGYASKHWKHLRAYAWSKTEQTIVQTKAIVGIKTYIILAKQSKEHE